MYKLNNITKFKYIKLSLLIVLIIINVLFFYKSKNNAVNTIINKLTFCTEEKPFNIDVYNKKTKTIIVSHFTLNNNFIDKVIENHRQYAKKHGYDYWFRNGVIEKKFSKKFNDLKTGIHWQKPIVIQQAMKILDEDKKYKYEWILWLDGDAVFTDFNKSLEKLRQENQITNKHFFTIARDMSCTRDNICPEYCCFNAGVLLVRNNALGRAFIKKIIDQHPKYVNNPVPEQTATQDLILRLNLQKQNSQNKCNLPIIPGVMVVESEVMNSGYLKNWQAGHFIAHVTGTGNVDNNTYREKLILNLLECMKNNKYNNLDSCEFSKLNN